MKKWNVFKAPFTLEEVPVSVDFEPDLKQEYLVQYKWKGDDASIFVIGKFHKQWYGYSFHFFWGASSLQLSTEKYSNDIENFLGIWEMHRLPEPARPSITNFVTQEDMEL